MEPTIVQTVIPLIGSAAYTIILIALFVRRGRQERQVQWLLAFLAASILWQLLLFFFPAPTPLSFIPVKILLLNTVLLGMTTAVYSDWPQRRWLVVGGVAIVLSLALDIFVSTVLLPLPESWTIRGTAGGIASLLVWLGLSTVIWLRIWRSFRETRFPWHANRLLFWAIVLLLVICGEALLFSQLEWAFISGGALRFLGAIGLAYAIANHRIFDVRARIQRLLAFVLILFISALPAAGIFFLVQWYMEQFVNQTVPSSVLMILILAAAFILYIPFRHFFERALYRYLIGEEFKTNIVVRNYSQAISRTLDVDQLSKAIAGTISDLLGTNRGALLLVSRNGSNYEIEPITGIGRIHIEVLRLLTDSGFIQALSQRHQPLLQYEVDFNPAYQDINSEERDWLKQQAMEVYVPVSDGNEIAGIIALGPKKSGVPYRPNELDLVQTLADQTVVALENARLYSEMGSQNERIRLLNDDLRKQNERLGIMDQVKTDFITIASHELRTPLTQVKGYADILAAMNEESALTREQTREIIGHINRATLQLERLISAMLDASQLDVDGMRLTFVQTRLDTVIRLAVEPLYQALRERRITLLQNGVDEVPPMYADFKRLVQAFHNLIGNAVKYTPDGGTITVLASLIPSDDPYSQYVEIVVLDTGIGIDKKYHELIFEKFFRIGDPQLHSTGSTKFKGAGPGLGLPIALGVIEAHGGRIWVESDGYDEQKLPGSKFHVILPVQPKALADESETEREQEVRPAWLIG